MMASECRDEVRELFAAEVFAGRSAASERLRLQVGRFAPHFRTVLLIGEAGVGKKSVARELHRLSPAHREGFLLLTVEKFLSGTGWEAGVLYLEGLGGLTLANQMLMLEQVGRLGRETRLVLGCESDPRGMVAAGRMHAEVLARVGTLEMRVVPLRERREDLRELAGSMLARLGASDGVREEIWRTIEGSAWAGNFPELWRACERFAACGTMEAEHTVHEAEPLTVRLEEVVERHVMGVLERCAGNKLKAAEMLGISRSTLYRMLGSA